jgi:hypothetical protein
MGRAPVKAGIALQQIGGPNSLSLDQIIVPQVAEVVRQPFRKTILPPSVDSHQRRIGTIPISDLLRQGRSAPHNRLGSHQQSIKPIAWLPHLLWSMDEYGWSMRRTFEGRNYRCQHILVGVLDRREVILATGHWCRSCEKVKGEFDGDQSASTVPS